MPAYRQKRAAPEPVFEHPPVWIHESVAVLLLSRRDARRRAILAMIDEAARRPSGRRATAARRSQS